MKLRPVFRFFVVSVALVAGLFAFTNNAAFAAPALSETKAIASLEAAATDSIRNATVNLYCSFKSGKKTWSLTGSGVLISDRGIILTNAHVAQFFLLAGAEKRAKGTCSVRTGSPAKERYSASVLYIPPAWIKENISENSKAKLSVSGENDFALLYITGAKNGPLPDKFPALPVGTSGTAADLEPVTVAGYPAGKLSFSKIRDKLAVVTAATLVANTQSLEQDPSFHDVLTLAASAAASDGISGAPVVDGSGEVIGIVTSKSLTKGSRVLRAITLSYIDRALRAQTAFGLDSLLTEDLSIRAIITSLTLPPEVAKNIANRFLGPS